MLTIVFSGQFKKDFRLAMKRGCNPKKLTDVIELLQNETPLPSKYKDHPLTDSRKYKNVRECHIEPDWLLVYQIKSDTLILRLLRTGTHSDLF